LWHVAKIEYFDAMSVSGSGEMVKIHFRSRWQTARKLHPNWNVAAIIRVCQSAEQPRAKNKSEVGSEAKLQK